MRTPLLVIATCLLVLSGCANRHRARPPAPHDRTIKVSTKVVAFALRNGARVMVVRDTQTDLVHVAARYEVGAIDDPVDRSGLAHLVEHLAFMVADGERTLGSKLAESALYSNAHTTLDYTHFDAQALASELGTLLEVEASRLKPGLCDTISDQLFAREREVVLNELRQRHSRADWRGLLNDEAYPAGHPYRRRVGGSETSVAKITKAEACAFMDAYYLPAHATIVISGDVDKAGVDALLRTTVMTVAGRPPLQRTRPPHAPIRRGVRARKRDVSKPHLIAMWSLPAVLGEGEAAVELAMSNLSYKAGKALRAAKLGDVVAVTRIGGAFSPVGIVIAELEDENDARKAMKKIVEVSRLVGKTLDRDQFRALKTRALADAVRSYDSLSARADRFADYLQLGGGAHGYFVQELERIHSLTRDRVQAIAETVFDPSQARWVIVSPAKSSSEYQAVPSQFSGITHQDGGHDVRVDPEEAERPLAVKVSKSRLHRARRFTLENGLRVALLPSSSVPTVELRLVFGSGNAAEPEDSPGIADVAAQYLRFRRESGYEQIRAINKFIDLGASVQASVDEDSTTFAVVGLEPYADILLEGLSLYVEQGEYEKDAVDRYRKRVAERLADEKNHAGRRLARAINRAVYGDHHVYSRLGYLSSNTLPALSAKNAAAYRKRNYVGRNGLLIVTGKFDLAQIERQVRYLYAGFSPGAPQRSRIGLARPVATRLGVTSDDQPTVSIAIAYPAPAGLDKNLKQLAAWNVLVRMLSGRVGDVRRRMAASYGMSASLSINRGPSSLIIGGDVDRRRAGAALKATLSAIEELRTGAFAVDFVLARRSYAAQLSATTNSARSTARRLSFGLRNGLDASYLGQLVQEVAKLRPADLRSILDRLSPERQSVLLYGPRADLIRAFGEAGISDARVSKATGF